jgi:hypothetical protein
VTLYDDALNSTWQDWSWSSTRNFANTSPIKLGNRSIRTDFSAWGGLSLRHNSGITTTSNTKLTFWAYAPTATTLIAMTQTQDSGAQLGNVTLKLPAGIWTFVTLSQSQLGNPSLIKRVSLQLGEANTKTAYFDQITVIP